MALETKPAKDPAAEDKHELDPKRKAALDTALAQVETTAFFTFAGAFRYGCFAGNISRVLPALNRNICAFGVRVYSSPMAVALSLSERG